MDNIHQGLSNHIKWCSGCSEWKAKTNFSKNRVRKDGLQNYCKTCAYQAHRESVNRETVNAAARRKRRAAKIERLYGMTVQEFDLLVFEQNGQCPICHRELDDAPVPYETALLCATCGAGLRFFEQSTDLLFRAISFLDSFKLRETSAVKDESQEYLLATRIPEENT